MYHSVFIGEVMVELPTTENEAVTMNVAGDTFNSAVYFKRAWQESHVSYLTALGTDNFSQRIIGFAEEEGLDTSLILKHRNRLPGLYAIETDEQGERRFHYWRERSAARDLMHLVINHGIKLKNADLIYFSGITLAVLSVNQRQMLLDFIQESKNVGATIAFDPNYRAILWESCEEAAKWTRLAYQLSDIAFPGGDDHLVLYDHQSAKQIEQFLAPMSISEIVLKDGANPVRIITTQENILVPVTHVEDVVDTTSAGDGFTAGYLACRGKGMSVEDSVVYAATLAGDIIRHRGAIIPYQATHYASDVSSPSTVDNVVSAIT